MWLFHFNNKGLDEQMNVLPKPSFAILDISDLEARLFDIFVVSFFWMEWILLT